MRFIHAADIHLDSPLEGLSRYDGAPADEVRGACRRALENLVQLAITREVDFVLLAGDIYDGKWKDPNTGYFFFKEMSKLQAANIPVIAISGNHDAESRVSTLLKQDSVTFLSSGTPETIRLSELQVAIHGRGFTSSAEPNNVVTQYPAAVPGHLNIGMLHTSLDLDGGEHKRYAPCHLDDLRALGYDYWALGHIHQRRVVCENPLVMFPGNIQGRHIRESGVKGCLLVEANSRNQLAAEFQSLDVMRWEHCAVDATGARSLEDVLKTLSGNLSDLLEVHDRMPLAVRVTFTGNCAAHAELVSDVEGFVQQVRVTAIGATNRLAWVEKVIVNTQAESNQPSFDEGAMLLLRDVFEKSTADTLLLAELASEYKVLVQRLRAEQVELRTNDPQWLLDLLTAAKSEVFARLNGPEAGA